MNRGATALLLVLTALALAPVWAVDYFMTQDGPAHAYSAWLMRRLLGGDLSTAQLFALNPWTLSSSIGHWLLVLLLSAVSPVTATKVMVTLTYAGVVAAVGFLRLATAGRDGLPTSLLFGAAIGFNWLWLGGLYNFLIGAIGLAVTLGLFCRWQDRLGPARVLGLSALILLVYVSHIVAFGVLVAALLLVAVCSDARVRRHLCAGVLVALCPVVLLALLYGSAAAEAAPGGEPLFPVWRRLSDPWSVVSWASHIRTADPFFLLSRKTFPFSDATSSLFAVFTPLLWLLGAASALAWTTMARSAPGPAHAAARHRLPLAAVFAACALAAAFGPDDFGTSHGTLLRERLAFLAAVLFVPLYRTDAASRGTQRFAHACLAAVILFQTAALWEYARQTSHDAAEFLAAGDALDGQESVAAVVVLENGLRFHSNPTAELSNLLGIGRRLVVWDNYQIGYHLFPVVARDPALQRFVFELTRANVLDEAEPAAAWDAKVARLDAFFRANHSRIETVLVWRGHPQVDAALARWYEAEPFFQHGRGRLYRRRAEAAITLRLPTSGDR